jgi:hypothetical protein
MCRKYDESGAQFSSHGADGRKIGINNDKRRRIGRKNWSTAVNFFAEQIAVCTVLRQNFFALLPSDKETEERERERKRRTKRDRKRDKEKK